jgi:hypothetical protein
VAHLAQPNSQSIGHSSSSPLKTSSGSCANHPPWAPKMRKGELRFSQERPCSLPRGGEHRLPAALRLVGGGGSTGVGPAPLRRGRWRDHGGGPGGTITTRRVDVR